MLCVQLLWLSQHIKLATLACESKQKEFPGQHAWKLPHVAFSVHRVSSLLHVLFRLIA